jgi:cell volume regulation protein A
MTSFLIISAVVLLLSIVSSKLLYRLGIPTLLIFLGLGMVFGSDGLVGIDFSDYEIAKNVCSVGLVFIMFYGGFGTNWKMAKPYAVQSILLSTVGVIVTAGLAGLFCCLVLRMPVLEGLLLASVVASTDAASVFSILRSRKLNLKGGLASTLEVESGSNDPVAYMLTMVILMLMSQSGTSALWVMLLKQIGFGLGIGFLLAFGSVFILKHISLEIDGLYPIFVTAIALLSYALTEYIGGNGYLCVYIVGIILGNTKFSHKKSLVHFFDGISWLMQIMLFFTLGLLSFPSKMPEVILPAAAVSAFLILVARPAAVFGILKWFHIPTKQILFVSWVGLRGAASIVFALFVISSNVSLHMDIYHMVFFIALCSVALQGTLLPLFAKKLDLVQEESSVMKTFTDYQEHEGTKLLEVPMTQKHRWVNQTLIEADIPDEVLVVMIKRGQEVVIPKGSTKILSDDILVLSGKSFDNIAE